jgi:pyruvate/2-oxoglutarate dehydrogenase complex dihydrolipoamide acyltransferase (E2) component
VAQERGIDLRQITRGSGMDGMITSRDVESFAPGAAATHAGAGAGMPFAAAAFGAPPGPGVAYTDADLSNMRRTIAKRLQVGMGRIL